MKINLAEHFGKKNFEIADIQYIAGKKGYAALIYFLNKDNKVSNAFYTNQPVYVNGRILKNTALKLKTKAKIEVTENGTYICDKQGSCTEVC